MIDRFSKQVFPANEPSMRDAVTSKPEVGFGKSLFQDFDGMRLPGGYK